jgi:hypothetical protein
LIILTSVNLKCIEFSQALQFQEVASQIILDRSIYNNGHSVADYDRDGDLDIFIVAHNSFSESDTNTWSRLVQNNGDNTFVDVTIASSSTSLHLRATDCCTFTNAIKRI